MGTVQSMKRPKYLNLLAIRLPLPGFVSILHRISGILLIYSLPFLIWALSVAMDSPAGYAKVADVFAHPLIKLLLLGVIWSSVQHLCSGIRFLLLEMRVGIELPAARLGAMISMVASVLITLLLAYWLLLP
jgi:succinate dehydrogenase / fumarate reductase cytochrome b subunit